MKRLVDQQNLLWLCLLLSLLLHVLLVWLLRDLSPLTAGADKPERIVVALLPRDLDAPIRPELDKPREKMPERLGARNQVVEKEQAPRGDRPEEMRPDAPAPPAERPRPRMVAPQPAKSEPAPASRTRKSPVRVARPERPQQAAGRGTGDVASEAPQPLPDLESLLQLPDTTVARLGPEWRRKERADVAEGDEVWLDMGQDLLFSFFQRLRTNIYNVWNYPADAARRGEEGACLLRMTFDRDGNVIAVERLRTSGYPALDRAATAAVRKGAPYGALPKAWPKERLVVKAWFRYDLSRSRTRGSDIYGR